MSDSAGHEIIHDKESIRLFKSNFLEFFTHIHPVVVAIIWIPVLVYFMTIAIKDHLAAAIPLAFLFYGLFYLIWVKLLGAPQWLAPTFSGFIAGYLIYDLTHYATHHFKIKRRYFKFVKFNHMQHHFKCPDKRFGVSSPIWDHVFGTSPSE